MGDIIYTTPVIRCLKKQIPGVEIHFLTKKTFEFIFDGNPYLDKLHLLKDQLSETITELKNEKFDYVIDLHNVALFVRFLLSVSCTEQRKACHLP